MTDEIARLVAEAKAQALAARAADAARERAEREQRLERERQIAEALLHRVRPLLDRLAKELDRSIEGDWHVEWHATAAGDAALRVESPSHPGRFAVAIDRDWRVRVEHRSHEHDGTQAPVALGQLEADLLPLIGHWVAQLMVSPAVRLRD